MYSIDVIRCSLIHHNGKP